MGENQIKDPNMDGGTSAFSQDAPASSETAETAGPLGVIQETQEDGSADLLLSGQITLTRLEDDKQEEKQLKTETLRLRTYEPADSWSVSDEGQIDSAKIIIISGGTLSRTEDGSLLIEGSEEEPAKLELADRGEEDIAALDTLIKFDGASLLTEEDWTALEETEEAPAPSPEPEQVTVEWTDGTLRFSNPITFHADRDGFHVEQQASALEVRNYSDGQAWMDRNGSVLTDDQMLFVDGGVCTVSGDSLIIDCSEEHPVFLSSFQKDETHQTHSGVCVEYTGLLGPVAETPPTTESTIPLWCLGGTALLAALLGAGITALLKGRKKRKPKMPQPQPQQPILSTAVLSEDECAPHLDYGMLQNIGKRASQQDSYGLFGVSGGVLAVVADGMGGLKNGDAVSQKIVQTMEEDCKKLTAAQMRSSLLAMAAHANDEVNRMLGPNELYKSGSTLVAALAEPQQFTWVSIGDSRIYLYRAGKLLQLNREHDYEGELLVRAVNHQLSFPDARNNPKRRSVSSFIGMGTLKYVDEMRKPIQTLKGDRILLCSDGVFNTLTERHIESILAEYPNPKSAAANLEAAVLAANNPHQDNFTAVLFSYD